MTDPVLKRNLWFGSVILSAEDKNRRKPVRSTICDVIKDSIDTKADQRVSFVSRNQPYCKSGPFICLHFAKGTCKRGAQCVYRHRLPTSSTLTLTRDVFGRPCEKELLTRTSVEIKTFYAADFASLTDSIVSIIASDVANRLGDPANGTIAGKTQMLLENWVGKLFDVKSYSINQSKSAGYIATVKLSTPADAQFVAQLVDGLAISQQSPHSLLASLGK